LRQLTIRGFDLELEQKQKIRTPAQREGISMNNTDKPLIRKGAELIDDSSARRIGSRLDKYAQTMSDQEGRELLGSISAANQIDPDMWRRNCSLSRVH